ncbi:MULTISPECIES: hypothetical protein, partial [unclassified Microcoleus]|uniref:hypothetical protein n=1 Tax=unclassified Microcoleus TaxID=2642155 RepID=UPI002FCEBA87
MPVPQENSSFVERASCPFLTSFPACSTKMLSYCGTNRQDACSTKMLSYCGTNRQDACSTKMLSY